MVDLDIEHVDPFRMELTSPIIQAYFEVGNLAIPFGHPDRIPVFLLTNLLDQQADWPAPALLSLYNSQIGIEKNFSFLKDPAIVNSATWGPQLTAALTQVPSMSISMDIDDLLDSPYYQQLLSDEFRVGHILLTFPDDDPAAAEQLLPLVYEELRKLAASKLSTMARMAWISASEVSAAGGSLHARKPTRNRLRAPRVDFLWNNMGPPSSVVF